MHTTTRTCACGKSIEGHPARRYCTTCRPLRDRTAWKDAHKTPEAKATRRAYFKKKNADPDFVAHRTAVSRRWRRSGVKWLLGTLRRRALKAGVPFDLAEDDIVIPPFCPVLGIPIVKGDGMWTDNSPSIDRHKPALGYVRGNICVISVRANRIKNDATPDELRRVAAYAEKMP